MIWVYVFGIVSFADPSHFVGPSLLSGRGWPEIPKTYTHIKNTKLSP